MRLDSWCRNGEGEWQQRNFQLFIMTIFFFSKKTMRYNNSEVVIFVSSISFKSEKGKQSSSKET